MTNPRLDNAINHILRSCSYVQQNSAAKCHNGKWKIMVSIDWLFPRIPCLKTSGIDDQYEFMDYVETCPDEYVVIGDWIQNTQIWDDLPTESEAFSHLTQLVQASPGQDEKTLLNSLSSERLWLTRFRTKATLACYIQQKKEALMEHPREASPVPKPVPSTGHNQNEYLRSYYACLGTILANESPCLISHVRECLKPYQYFKGIGTISGTIERMFPQDFLIRNQMVLKLHETGVPARDQLLKALLENGARQEVSNGNVEISCKVALLRRALCDPPWEGLSSRKFIDAARGLNGIQFQSGTLFTTIKKQDLQPPKEADPVSGMERIAAERIKSLLENECPLELKIIRDDLNAFGIPMGLGRIRKFIGEFFPHYMMQGTFVCKTDGERRESCSSSEGTASNLGEYPAISAHNQLSEDEILNNALLWLERLLPDSPVQLKSLRDDLNDFGVPIGLLRIKRIIGEHFLEYEVNGTLVSRVNNRQITIKKPPPPEIHPTLTPRVESNAVGSIKTLLETSAPLEVKTIRDHLNQVGIPIGLRPIRKLIVEHFPDYELEGTLVSQTREAMRRNEPLRHQKKMHLTESITITPTDHRIKEENHALDWIKTLLEEECTLELKSIQDMLNIRGIQMDSGRIERLIRNHPDAFQLEGTFVFDVGRMSDQASSVIKIQDSLQTLDLNGDSGIDPPKSASSGLVVHNQSSLGKLSQVESSEERCELLCNDAIAMLDDDLYPLDCDDDPTDELPPTKDFGTQEVTLDPSRFTAKEWDRRVPDSATKNKSKKNAGCTLS